jgi:hypothetical protein
MDYESTQYECDIWQGVVVITCKESRRCGSIAMTNKKTRQNAGQMIKADIKKYGAEKALAIYAKLVENWQ